MCAKNGQQMTKKTSVIKYDSALMNDGVDYSVEGSRLRALVARTFNRERLQIASNHFVKWVSTNNIKPSGAANTTG